MDVLHLYANHKITGPAELALETARALLARGVAASFYSSDVRRRRHRDRWLQLLARERGVPEPPLRGVRLGKHHSPLAALLDVWRLTRAFRDHPPGLVHCHQPNDHLLAARALRRAGAATPLVRTLYDDELPPPTRRTREAFGPPTARVLCLSRRVADELVARAGDHGLDPAAVAYLPPPIDVVRFDPARGVPPRRAALGLGPEDFVLGIVARMQTHRRYEVLLEAVRRARAEVPGLRLVVVGRGTKQEEVARGPVRALGLSEAVVFSGYVAGDDYVGTLAALDAKVFLVPGSDGTCRAVREALAMGLPVVATRRGMLPELVRDGVDGLLVDEEPEALATAFVRLARDAAWRRGLGQAARAGAVERFAFERFAAAVEDHYRVVPGSG